MVNLEEYLVDIAFDFGGIFDSEVEDGADIFLLKFFLYIKGVFEGVTGDKMRVEGNKSHIRRG